MNTPARLLAAALVAVAMGIAALAADGAKPAYAAVCTYTLGTGTVAVSVTEGQTGQITVTRSGDCPTNELVALTPSSPGGFGFATMVPDPEADINFSQTSASFVGGSSAIAIIPTREDTEIEGDETFTLTLEEPITGSTIGGTTSATVTILDNDGPPSFSFSASNYPVNENAGTVTITVNRAGAEGQAVSVDYFTSNGTATAPADYTAITPTTLEFSSVQTSRTFTVTIVNDSSLEDSETFTVHLDNASNGGSEGSPATVTINDDDGAGTVQFSANTYNISESGGSAQILVTRTGGTTGSVTVNCTATPGTAVHGSDFTQGVQVLTFGDGVTQRFCEVPILNDTVAESQETVLLTLSGGTAAIGTPNSATLFIDDDDGTGNIAFSSATYSGPENGGAITITVNRLSGTGSSSVTYTVAPGPAPSATAGSDFVAATGTLTWGVGDFAAKTFTVTPIDDVNIEGIENILLTLSNPIGGTLGSPSSAILTLTDNESPQPVITSISPNSGSVLGGTVITITGLNFTNATSVTVGGSLCTSMSVTNATTIICTTPAHTQGTVDVIVNAPSGQSLTAGSANDFTYTGGPTITNLNPNTGPAAGNTIVTITGTNFTQSGTQVRFDNIVATHNVIDENTIIAVSPGHSAGTIRVTVTTPGGTSPDTAADDFTYTGQAIPVVSGLNPTSGPVGTTVVITGSGFTNASSVTFGGVAAVYTVNSDAQITATVPATTPTGVVDVRVTGPTGQSANTSADNYTNTTSQSTQLVTYTLFFRFTLIVWSGPNNISALAALRGMETPDNPNTNDVSNLVGAIWRFDPATQSFDGYFPGSDNIPGANDFTTLQNGVGYFVSILNPGTVSWTSIRVN